MVMIMHVFPADSAYSFVVIMHVFLLSFYSAYSAISSIYSSLY